MARQISKSVGLKGINVSQDVKTIQEMLNHAMPDEGGPPTELKVDGKCGSKTNKAIGSFQLHHFGWSGADSRVDPGHQTLAKLNEIWDRPVKGTVIIVDRLRHNDVLELDHGRDWIFRITVSRFGRLAREDSARFQFAHPKFRKPVVVPKNSFGFGKSSILMVTRSLRPITIDEVAGPAEIESIGPAGKTSGIVWTTSFKRGPIFGNVSQVHLDPEQPENGPWTQRFVANHMIIRYRGDLRRISEPQQSAQSPVKPRIGRAFAIRH